MRRFIIPLLLLIVCAGLLPPPTQAQDSPFHARDLLESPWRGAVIELCHADYPWECADPAGYPGPDSFALLADLGANIVVIEVQYLWTIEPPYVPVEVEFARLEDALDAAAAVGLDVVVSMRNGPGRNEALPENEGEALTALYEDAAAQEAYILMLVDMIAYFDHHPAVVAWEPMGEPTPHTYFDPDETYDEALLIAAEEWWHDFAARALAAMRAADPVHPIVIEPTFWGNPEAFAWMTPYDDDNLIYSVHTYEPFEYTHQYEEPYEVEYPGGEVWGETINQGWLDANLDPVREFQAAHDVPILVGEWGGVRWVPNMVEYVTDQLALFEAEGWSWTIYAWSDQVWEYGGFEPLYGLDPDNTALDPTNPLFAPIAAAWAMNE